MMENMDKCDTNTQTSPTLIPVEDLISSKEIQAAFKVKRATVHRWAKSFNWTKLSFSHKVVRYLRKEVEESMGVSFNKEAVS